MAGGSVGDIVASIKPKRFFCVGLRIIASRRIMSSKSLSSYGSKSRMIDSTPLMFDSGHGIFTVWRF
jgi:hypothetical protein